MPPRVHRIRKFSQRVTGNAVRGVVAIGIAVLSGCAEPTGAPLSVTPLPNNNVMAAVLCTVQVATRDVRCGGDVDGGGASRDMFGTQNTDVKLTSSAVSYAVGIFQFSVTVQNLTPEAIGTPNGTFPDSTGIRVFFNAGPTVTAGTGTITVANPDGTATFTAAGQPYYQYNEVLAQNAVSTAKTWQLNVPATVTSFSFYMLLSTTVQPLLVINEVLANPGGTISDANGEWFEIYNRGSRAVKLSTFLYSDSAPAGRRPYFAITDTILKTLPGGYVVFGNTFNTTNNGGVPVDYAYGNAIALGAVDAIKISLVYGIDTLTIDQIQYSINAISNQNGIARELLNPALPNLDMDGANWADALISAVYGPGGRGTPKAQNSTFTP